MTLEELEELASFFFDEGAREVLDKLPCAEQDWQKGDHHEEGFVCVYCIGFEPTGVQPVVARLVRLRY